KRVLIGEIIKRFESRGLKIVALHMTHPTREQMDTHYPKDKEWVTGLGNNTEKSYKEFEIKTTLKEDYGTDDPYKIGKLVREWLLDYMTSAPLVKMVIKGLHAVDMVRKIAGPTIPNMADMGTIRGDFSNDSPILGNLEKRAVMNLVHASETPEEAEHEIEFWFGSKDKIFDYKRFGVDE
ncbi:MAG: nucleoside-diphosphate kinase, partial [Patescibacteria group bacterium]